MPKILIEVYDIDDCLFNKAYLETKDVVRSNPLLIEAHRNLLKNGFTKTYTMLASQRGCIHTDFSKCHKQFKPVGSAFPAIETFTKALSADGLEAKLYPFLLADIFEGLDIGASFKQALDCLEIASEDRKSENLYPQHFDPKCPQVPIDSTKVVLFYALIQDIANYLIDSQIIEPTDEVTVVVYEDNSSVLNALNTFFSQHSECIPRNFTLNPFRYDGQHLTESFELQGTGEINADYKEATIKLAQERVPDAFAALRPRGELYKDYAEQIKRLRETPSSAPAQGQGMPFIDFSLFGAPTEKESPSSGLRP